MQGFGHSRPNSPIRANPEQLAPFWALVQARVAAAGNLTAAEKADILANGRTQIEDYFNGKGTRATIRADFDRVSRWAEHGHIAPSRIFVGEFGATQKGPTHSGALPDDRARWLADVRQEIEGHGFHWSFWNLEDQGALGMSLVSMTDENSIDPKTAAAIGKPIR